MDSLYHSVQIGSLKLQGNIFLAPLAGYTDRIFRSICLENGADLAYTEMVSAEGVARNSDKTLELMLRGKGEKVLAVQLFMPDADTASRSIDNLMKYQPDMIDINCGCPVPKVTKTGAGSSLMKRPDEIGRIVKVLREGTGLPVSVKIRTGWDCESINYLECAQMAFDAGAGAVCMHARTKSQLYRPFAHWDLLRDLKQHFCDCTIIGSGDLFNAEDGVRMLEETGVDAVSYARGAIGNPFIFAQTKNLISGKGALVIPNVKKVEKIMEHLTGLCTIMDEGKACREMRKHVCEYLKGIPNCSVVKNLATSAVSVEMYKNALALLN